MTEATNPTTQPAANELVITRVFDAPRELVWKAWTEKEHFVAWWGPRGFTTPACEIDLRPGGRVSFCMRSPEGADIWVGGVYKEIVPPSRIVVTDFFADERGNPVPPSHYGMTGEWPAEALITLTFDEVDGKTRLTLRHAGVPVDENGEMAEAGWNESLDKLAEFLAKA